MQSHAAEHNNPDNQNHPLNNKKGNIKTAIRPSASQNCHHASSASTLHKTSSKKPSSNPSTPSPMPTGATLSK